MMALTEVSFAWKPGFPRQSRRAALLLVLLAACGHATAAGPLLYTLEIPDARAVTFEVPLEVRHPGLLTVRAEWDGTRQIALRVDRPDLPVAVARASGPSPLELTIEVSPDSAGMVDWRLAIHSVAARGGGEGLLTIELPPPPGSEPPEGKPAPTPPAVPPTEPEPWMEPRRAPPGAPADQVRVYDAGERYRALLLEPSEEPQPDSCRWQNDLMRYLSGQLDALAQGGPPPEGSTGRLLTRIADAVDTVEALRTSNDPLVAGPPPEERERRELWLRLRREEFQVVEGELDALAEQVMRGHAPELEDQAWALRMVICLTACERHFEARGRVGEEQATNRDLTRNQWERLLAAAEALRALAGVVGSG
jgi:hypothetical protein